MPVFDDQPTNPYQPIMPRSGIPFTGDPGFSIPGDFPTDDFSNPGKGTGSVKDLFGGLDPYQPPKMPIMDNPFDRDRPFKPQRPLPDFGRPAPVMPIFDDRPTNPFQPPEMPVMDNPFDRPIKPQRPLSDFETPNYGDLMAPGANVDTSVDAYRNAVLEMENNPRIANIPSYDDWVRSTIYRENQGSGRPFGPIPYDPTFMTTDEDMRPTTTKPRGSFPTGLGLLGSLFGKLPR
jgi:hypothetical protein